MDPQDIVGALEIVARAQEELGAAIPIGTVRSWEKRRRAWVDAGRPARSASRPWEEPLPDPIGTANGGAIWSWATIKAWLKRTGKGAPST
ncbi:hypothetical protein ACQPYK_08475 [Streptosporangium sp. CA-135522]|uniref:hypothetical protein n=1 Tax=Streptosporangium sp. CA-135522 TaxID=3240072 RepID=UPI003D8B69E5